MQDILSKSETRRYIRSSSFIMALIFTVFCGLTALSFGYFITYFTKGHFVHSTEVVLDTEFRLFQNTQQINNGENERTLQIPLDENGNLTNGMPKEITRLVEGIIIFTYPKNNKEYAAKIYTYNENQKILIATDITDIQEQFRFMQLLGIASICFVMIVVFFSYLISVFVVSGTNKIADTAREIIQTGDLSRRLHISSRWDDLSNMAIVLNILLDRVEELMRDVREVSDNIAHDLRTPLTRLRSKLENLEESENKTKLLYEAEHLLNTFNALLRISRIESEQKRSDFQSLNFKALLEDVIEFYEPLAEEKSIELSKSLKEIDFFGDKDLLFQAYANLLDNALKFTPKNGKIDISLKKVKKKIVVQITDSGDGIEPGDEEKIFNRFYRAEKSRTTKGTGLGLSLVQAVIQLHDGEIRAENEKQGLKIITRF